MHFSTPLLALTSLLTLTSAKIIIGDLTLGKDTYTLAWNADQDACSTAKVLSKAPANPCGKRVDIQGYSGASLEGCGGPLWINVNGQFRHNCRQDRKFIPTICPNPGGGFGAGQLAPIRQTYVCE
ncbi:hypothetical protein ABW20_dc0102531 [Dactylellina cionopaga]|nr:hypothetical protein ABW20_dc0102531 [Dactylellina cionopaga]